MRRKRLPARVGGAGPQTTALAKRETGTDLRHLEQVVQITFPVRAAKSFLQRHLGNRVSYKLVECVRGEQVGIVRLVEVRHTNSGDRTYISCERVLANGEPASHFVPDHLVRLVARVQGAAADSRSLHNDDEIVLHVPVRGYLRFLPTIFQGEGPIGARDLTLVRESAIQKYGGGAANEQGIDWNLDEDPLRRFMFIFQHVMTTVTERIDRIIDLCDPLLCEAKFLPWLASWVGFELDESLPVHQQRELVRRAIRLYRTRGTRAGVEEMVRVLTSAPVRIRERQRPGPACLGKAVIVGGKDVVERYHAGEPPGVYLVEPSTRASTSFFMMTLEPRDRFKQRFGERAAGVLRRIVNVVSQERPIHVAFTIQFDDRGI